MVEVLKTPKYPCSICKRKEATQFCDFVIGYGLLARTTTSKNDGRYSIWEVSGMNLQTLLEKQQQLDVNLTFNPIEVNARIVEAGKPILLLNFYVLMKKEIAVE